MKRTLLVFVLALAASLLTIIPLAEAQFSGGFVGTAWYFAKLRWLPEPHPYGSQLTGRTVIAPPRLPAPEPIAPAPTPTRRNRIGTEKK